MTDRKRLIFLGCIAGLVVFLVIKSIIPWYEEQKGLFEAQQEQAQQKEQAQEEERAQTELQRLKDQEQEYRARSQVVTLDSQRSQALLYRDMTSQYLGSAAGNQMYECVVHGFNKPHEVVTVEGVPPLSYDEINACTDLYKRLNSAIERFNRGY